MLTPIVVTKESEYLGDECAVCKTPFAPHDDMILCPIDETRHHPQCWHGNGNHCAALACAGEGQVVGYPAIVAQTEAVAVPTAPAQPRRNVSRPGRGRERERPAWLVQLAQSCLIMSIGLAIVVMAFACFGLWLAVDYVMIEVLEWNYRPIPQLIPLILMST